MALQVWLPLMGDVHNQGLYPLEFNNTNAQVSASGCLGSCYSFTATTGTGINAAIASNDFLTRFIDSHSFSFCCWFKTTANTSTPIAHITYGLRFFVGTSTTFSMYNSTRTVSVNANTATNDGKWHHYTATYDLLANKLAIYIDGVLKNTTSYTAGATYIHSWTNNFYIGRDPNNSTANAGYFFQGNIQDVRFYDHSLSTKEVKEISKGLAIHYKLNEQYVGNITNMLTPGGTYGTTTGSTWTGHYYVGTVEDAVGPVPFTRMNKLAITVSGTTTGGGASLARQTNIPVQPSTQYTYSTYVKPSDNFAYTHPNFLYRYEYDSAGTKTIEQGINNISKREYVGDGWYRIWNTFTTQATTAKMHVYFYTYPGKTMTYYLGGCQLELGDTLHVYTEGTYSNSMMPDSSGYIRNGEHFSGTVIPVKTEGLGRNEYAVENIDGYIGKATVNMPPMEKVTFAWWANYKVFGAQTSGLFSTSNVDGHPTDYNTTACNMRDSYFDMCNTAGSCKRLSATGIELNKWHHYCITYDGATEKFYVDGVEKSSIAQTWALKDWKYLYISYSRAGGVIRMCRGAVSDFRVYCTALSADDVKELYDTAASVDNNGNFYCYELKEV